MKFEKEIKEKVLGILNTLVNYDCDLEDISNTTIDLTIQEYKKKVLDVFKDLKKECEKNMYGIFSKYFDKWELIVGDNTNGI